MMTYLTPIDSNSIDACILCESANLKVVETIKYASLREVYRSAFSVNIDHCIAKPYTSADIIRWRCLNCSLDFFHPRLAGTSLLYELLTRNAWYYGAEKWEFAFAERHLKGCRKVLEIGAGSGNFLSRARALNPNGHFVGLEYTPASAEKARARGHEVFETSIEQFAADHANRDSFDAVTSFQVLEHVANPDSFLRSAVSCLKPGGILILSVPHEDGFTRYAINDALNYPPHHLTRWRAGTFKSLATRLNLELEITENEPVANYHRGWYRSTLLARYMRSLLWLPFESVSPHDRRIRSRFVALTVRILDRIIPEKFWRYRLPGHTIGAVLRKPNQPSQKSKSNDFKF